MRGALQPGSLRRLEEGIIPACAGSTGHVAIGRPGEWDHPRMCGEHVESRYGFTCETGSSPHVRGALFCITRSPLDGGIIPACAGSTTCADGTTVKLRDHPRMCGEHSTETPVQPLSAGSSPHVRGAPSSRREGSWRCRDHPRMCGEHHEGWKPLRPQTGSSPHVRGAQIPARLDVLAPGIIPACAGSTR